MSITTTEAGLEKPDAQYPIEIDAGSAAEWLVDRKRVPASWRKRQPDLHRALAAAREASPATSKAGAVARSRTRLTALECDKALEAAMAEEPHTKSLLGRYTSPVLRAWSDAARAASSDSLGLMDAADEVANILKYEIPSLRKEVDRERKHAAELDRQSADIQAVIAQYHEQYRSLCEEWGIAGEDVRGELRGLSSCLGGEFTTAAASLRASPALAAAVELYRSFAAFASSSSWQQQQRQQGVDELPVLSLILRAEASLSPEADADLLKRLERFGGGPVRHNAKGKQQKKSQSESKQQQQQQQQPVIEIDWSAMTAEAEQQPQAAEAEAVAAAAVEIDWSALSADAEKDAAALESFAIELEAAGEDVGITTVAASEDAEQQPAAEEAPAAKSADEVLGAALGASPSLRKVLLANLTELRAFLGQRGAEARDEAGQCAFISTSGSLPSQSEAQLRDGIAAVDAALDVLQTERVRRLVELGSSQQYVERIARTFEQKVECWRGAEQSLARSKAKRAEADVQAARTRAKIEASDARLREVVQYVQTGIGQLFPGRRVTLNI